MKHLKTLIGLAVVSVGLLISGSAASAHVFRSSDNESIAQQEPIRHSLFTAGKTVDISTEVYGDVFCAGQTVTISSKVHGDVICAGQTVNITGQIDGDVRLAGQTVNVSGQIKGNASIAGQTFSLDSRAVIDGDLTTGASTATLNGKIGRDVAIGGENVTVAGQVGRNVQASLTKLYLAPNAQIAGSVEYSSRNDLDRANGAQVGGPITRTEPVQQKDNNKRGAAFGFNLGWFFFWLISLSVMALLFALLFPRLLLLTTSNSVSGIWKPLLVGFVAGIVVPIVAILVAITGIGLPIALMIMLGWLLILMASGPVFAFYLGRLLFKDKRSVWLTTLGGSALLTVLYFIPILGGLVFMLSIGIGSGALLLELKRYIQSQQTKTLVKSGRRS